MVDDRLADPGVRQNAALGQRLEAVEDADTAVLEKEEWNLLLDLIQSGTLRRI